MIYLDLNNKTIHGVAKVKDIRKYRILEATRIHNMTEESKC